MTLVVQPRLLTLEGGEGAGKSTVLAAIADVLRAGGQTVVCTREPGGTPLAEDIRALLLSPRDEPLHAQTELLLMFAARVQHVREIVQPALARGDWVLSDRFTDATFAYQGGGRGFDRHRLETLEAWVHAEVQPDLTMWFDLPAETAAARRTAARAPDRFEEQEVAFFNRVRDAYMARAAAAPQRIVRIDAAQDRAAVSEQIEHVLETRRW